MLFAKFCRLSEPVSEVIDICPSVPPVGDTFTEGLIFPVTRISPSARKRTFPPFPLLELEAELVTLPLVVIPPRLDITVIFPPLPAPVACDIISLVIMFPADSNRIFPPLPLTKVVPAEALRTR